MELADRLSALAADLVAWGATYLLHSTIFLGLAWIALRFGRSWSPRLREMTAKLALVGGLFTATVQVAGGFDPAFGRLLLPWADMDSEIVAVDPHHDEVLADGVGLRWTDGQDRPRVRPAAHRMDDLVLRAELVPAIIARREAALAEAAAAGGPAQPLRGGMPWSEWALALWIVGAGYGLLRLVRAFRALGGHLDARRPISGPLFAVLERLRRAADLRRRVKLTASSTLPGPVSLGRAEICVPDRAVTDLDPALQQGMLAHELGHLARRDPLWLVACSVLERVLFFQPLNAVLRRELQDASEYLCDDWAVRHTGGGVGLARCLAEVAGWRHAHGPVENEPALVATMAAQGSPLMKRVQRLLDEDRDVSTDRPSRLWLPAGGALLAFVAVVAPGAAPMTDPPRPAITPAPAPVAADVVSTDTLPAARPAAAAPAPIDDDVRFFKARPGKAARPSGKRMVLGTDDDDVQIFMVDGEHVIIHGGGDPAEIKAALGRHGNRFSFDAHDEDDTDDNVFVLKGGADGNFTWSTDDDEKFVLRADDVQFDWVGANGDAGGVVEFVVKGDDGATWTGKDDAHGVIKYVVKSGDGDEVQELIIHGDDGANVWTTGGNAKIELRGDGGYSWFSADDEDEDFWVADFSDEGGNVWFSDDDDQDEDFWFSHDEDGDQWVTDLLGSDGDTFVVKSGGSWISSDDDDEDGHVIWLSDDQHGDFDVDDVKIIKRKARAKAPRAIKDRKIKVDRIHGGDHEVKIHRLHGGDHEVEIHEIHGGDHGAGTWVQRLHGGDHEVEIHEIHGGDHGAGTWVQRIHGGDHEVEIHEIHGDDHVTDKWVERHGGGDHEIKIHRIHGGDDHDVQVHRIEGGEYEVKIHRVHGDDDHGEDDFLRRRARPQVRLQRAPTRVRRNAWRDDDDDRHTVRVRRSDARDTGDAGDTIEEIQRVIEAMSEELEALGEELEEEVGAALEELEHEFEGGEWREDFADFEGEWEEDFANFEAEWSDDFARFEDEWDFEFDELAGEINGEWAELDFAFADVAADFEVELEDMLFEFEDDFEEMMEEIEVEIAEIECDGEVIECEIEVIECDDEDGERVILIEIDGDDIEEEIEVELDLAGEEVFDDLLAEVEVEVAQG